MEFANGHGIVRAVDLVALLILRVFGVLGAVLGVGIARLTIMELVKYLVQMLDLMRKKCWW